MNVVDGPAEAAVFPAASEAEPEAMEMPTFPSPEQGAKVTVRVEVPAPETVAVHAAVPEAFTVILLSANVTEVAPV